MAFKQGLCISENANVCVRAASQETSNEVTINDILLISPTVRYLTEGYYMAYVVD